MGYFVALSHISFISLFSKISDDIIKEWSIRGVIIGMGLWLLIWTIFIISFYRFLPRFMGAYPAFGNDLNILSNIIKEIAIASGENKYEITLYTLDIDEPNAFACGKSTQKGAIVVTRGLLDILDRNELRAVLAHEFAHLKNGDSFYLAQAISYCWALIVTSIGAYYFVLISFALLLLASLGILKLTESLSDSNNGEGCLISIVGFGIAITLLVVGIYYLFIYVVIMVIALLLVALGIKASASTISKSREYLADACSAQWTRNPMALATALDKIRKIRRMPIRSLTVAPLWSYPPTAFKSGKLNRLFSFLLVTHPPIEERIKKLLEMGGSYAQLDMKLKEIFEVLKPSPWRRIKEMFLPVLATSLALFISFIISRSIIETSLHKQVKKAAESHETIKIEEVEVIKPLINLRKGPGTDHPILAKLYKGEHLKLLKEENDWLMVEYIKNEKSMIGWVHKQLVKKVEP